MRHVAAELALPEGTPTVSSMSPYTWSPQWSQAVFNCRQLCFTLWTLPVGHVCPDTCYTLYLPNLTRH